MIVEIRYLMQRVTKTLDSSLQQKVQIYSFYLFWNIVLNYVKMYFFYLQQIILELYKNYTKFTFNFLIFFFHKYLLKKLN